MRTRIALIALALSMAACRKKDSNAGVSTGGGAAPVSMVTIKGAGR
jgi:hypothetical protein